MVFERIFEEYFLSVSVLPPPLLMPNPKSAQILRFFPILEGFETYIQKCMNLRDFENFLFLSHFCMFACFITQDTFCKNVTQN